MDATQVDFDQLILCTLLISSILNIVVQQTQWLMAYPNLQKIPVVVTQKVLQTRRLKN